MIKLSVIIPTRNRARFLKQTIQSIAIQTLPQEYYEVIVVDNGSTDDTKDLVKSFSGEIKNLKYVFEEKPGLHRGRHRGLFTASSEILVFADDDIEAFPTWLEGVLESFQTKDVVLVGGKILPKFENTPPKWILDLWQKYKIIFYLSILDLGDETKEIDPDLVFGCNFSILKKILLEAKGFHPDGMPPELIKFRGDGETYVSRYILKQRYKTIYNPKASVYHYVPKERMTIDYFKRRAFLQGISDSYTDIRERKKRQLLYSYLKLGLKRLLGKDVTSEKSYLDGYIYHQKEVKKDPKLLQWVLKEDYLYD